MSNTTLLHDESCFELLCLQTGMSGVIWRAQNMEVSELGSVYSQFTCKKCCILVLFEVLTESLSIHQRVHW